MGDINNDIEKATTLKNISAKEDEAFGSGTPDAENIQGKSIRWGEDSSVSRNESSGADDKANVDPIVVSSRSILPSVPSTDVHGSEMTPLRVASNENLVENDEESASK